MDNNLQYIKEIDKYINYTVVPQLLKELCAKTETLMKNNLMRNTNISTQTLQKYVTSNIKANEAIIYIDYEEMSALESSAPEFSGMRKTRRKVTGSGLIEWGRFTNTFRDRMNYVGSTKWKGELISFRLAQWLEQGGRGEVGNQPITKNQWFTQTANDVEQLLDVWVVQIMNRYGFNVRVK